MKNRKNWWDDLQTRQDFIDVLPMFVELESIMGSSLFMARKLAKQTKERYCKKYLKNHTNISLIGIKEIVSSYEPNYLDLTYARFMYFEICEEFGYMDTIYGLNDISDESKQVMMFLEYWDHL